MEDNPEDVEDMEAESNSDTEEESTAGDANESFVVSLMAQEQVSSWLCGEEAVTTSVI